ncbi:MAG: glycosyltransferase [Phycisphaerae bacterium]|nr:glycosyltransferase [Phycisphaerae bacterium]
MIRTTLYVPCCNGAAYLAETLQAALSQSRAADEVLVVDDGSTDESAAIATRCGARVLRHGANRGLAAARNTARRASTGELLIGLDVDAVPAADYVERVAAAFERDASLAGLCGRLIESHTVCLPDLWRSVHMPQHHGESRAEPPRICFGSVSSFRVDAIDAVCGWNERYRTNYEDVDLSQRLIRAGLRCAYEPAAIARHQRRDSLASVLSGFWSWFAPRGRDAGHFASVEAAASKRLESVNFGIFRHRLARDLGEHRAHLSGITLLLPAWMTVHDLAECRASRGAAEAVVARFVERIVERGASDYVASRCRSLLEGLAERLFATCAGAAAGGELVERFGALCRRELPDERRIWAQIEFSLQRLEYEESLRSTWAGDTRIVIANPPWYTSERQGVRAGSRWPFTLDRRGSSPIPRYVPFPFFLAQAAQLLSDAGRPNAIIDAIAEGLTHDEFHERVLGYRPRAIVMETAAASFESDRALWRRLRRELPDATLILCGPHATARRGEILHDVPDIDLILIGEYERTLLSVAEALDAGGDWRAIRGIAFRDGGELVDTGRPGPVPFDEVGRADRLRLPLFNYRDPFGGLAEPMAQLMATRGCPYECSFCQWPQVFYERRKIQKRSAERVFEEVRELVERFGFRSVYFDDDMFGPGAEWLSRFCGLVRASGLSFEWGIMARADTFSDAQLRMMAEAGLRAAKFGAESGDQGMVDAMGKRLNLDRLRETCRRCRELGIAVHLTFTIGLPGESPQTLARTRELILELLPETLQISRAMPLPGTSFEDWAVERGALKTRDLAARDGFLISIVQHEQLSGEEIDRFIHETYAAYQQARRQASRRADAREPQHATAAT